MNKQVQDCDKVVQGKIREGGIILYYLTLLHCHLLVETPCDGDKSEVNV